MSINGGVLSWRVLSNRYRMTLSWSGDFVQFSIAGCDCESGDFVQFSIAGCGCESVPPAVDFYLER